MKKRGKLHDFLQKKFHQIFIFMKFLFILLFVCSMSIHATVFSQHVRLDINLKNASVVDVFREIRQKSDYRFVYDSDAIKKLPNVSLNLKNAEIQEIMDACLKDDAFTYFVEDDLIIIRESKQLNQEVRRIKITGKVVDDKRQPLPGVTIVLKGTTVGVSTDTDGNYELNIPEVENPVLVFSFIGMETKEITYTGQEVLNVTLVDDLEEMEEVVITGIFTRKSDSFTGSASTFRGEELKRMGSQNVLQSLKSLDPSFRITPDNMFGSDPNRLPNVNIRGVNNIPDLQSEYETDPNQPLFILDGIEVSLQTIVDLSMDRIASVTILKDATSTAIYGSRAANGVIVVETIPPIPGILDIRYNGTFTLNVPDLSDYNMMNAEEKLRFEELFGLYDDYHHASVEYRKRWYDLYNKRLKNIESGVNTYWLSEPVRTGFTHRHNVFAMGGGDAMYYGFGLNYSNNQGVMKKSGREIIGFNLDLRYRNNKVMVVNKFDLDHTDANDAPVAFSEYVKASPYYPKDNDGVIEPYLDDYLIASTRTQIVNPLYNASQKNINNTQTLSFTDNFRLEYRPIDDFLVIGVFSLTKTKTESKNFKSPYHTDFLNTVRIERGSYKKTIRDYQSTKGNITASYGKLFADVHQIYAVGRWEFQSNKSTSESYEAIGFADETITNPSFANQYPRTGKPTYSESISRLTGWLLNLSYGYKQRYLIDANIRRDGSSNYGSNKQFTNTWSFGVAWNMHNEEFMGTWADKLKMKFTAGNPGNDNVAYKTALTYNYNSTNQNLFGIGAEVMNPGNPNLKWLQTKKFTVGLESILFNNWVTFDIDFYKHVTDPLVLTIGVPASTGKSQFITNLGVNTIKGIDFNLITKIIDSPENNFQWRIGVTGYHERSKYSKIGNKLDDFNSNLNETTYLRYKDGGSSTAIYAMESAGIDPMSGLEVLIKKDGTYTNRYDYNEEVKIGDSQPDLEGNINTSVYWKGISVNVSLRYSFGGDLFNTELYEKIENVTLQVDLTNLDKRALYDRWQKPGDKAQYRRISSTISSGGRSSRYLQRNNFLTCETITIGYDFQDAPWLSRLHFSRLTLMATMNDIFRLSTVKAERGISYPFARNISLSVNVTF